MTQPLVNELRDLIPNRQVRNTARRIGIADTTVYHWWKGTDPRLSIFEAALNAVGYRLAIVPMEETNG